MFTHALSLKSLTPFAYSVNYQVTKIFQGC